VAFDCDGVLFDSAEANRAYYNRILLQFDLPDMTEEQFEYVHMHTVDEAIAYLIEDGQLLDQVNRFRKNLSYLPFIKHMRIEPHLKMLLEELRPVFKTAIATNRTDTMSRVLDEHDLVGKFDKVVTASDVKYPKPHPEQLYTLLEHFCIDAGQMLYVGDSALDAIAADAAQVPFVAYGNTKLKAHLHIDSLDRLSQLLVPHISGAN
jgi:phosphoglycolate phosphatase-like HAD superfamily hydrolase